MLCRAPLDLSSVVSVTRKGTQVKTLLVGGQLALRRGLVVVLDMSHAGRNTALALFPSRGH